MLGILEAIALAGGIDDVAAVGEPIDRRCKVQDIVVGSLRILSKSPSMDLAAWADRKPGRRRNASAKGGFSARLISAIRLLRLLQVELPSRPCLACVSLRKWVG